MSKKIKTSRMQVSRVNQTGLMNRNAVAQVMDMNDVENDLYTIMTCCSYICIPGVPIEILRLQLAGLDIALSEHAAYYGSLLQEHGDPVGRSLSDWLLLFTQIKEIRDGIAALIDPDDSDGGTALTATLRKYETSQNRERREKIQRAIDQRRSIEQAEKEAALEAAEQQGKIASLTTAQRIAGLEKWGIQQVINETGRTQTPAAELLLDRLKPAHESGRLSDELADVYRDLLQRCTGNNPRPIIAKIMKDDVIPIPWEGGSTRL